MKRILIYSVMGVLALSYASSTLQRHTQWRETANRLPASYALEHSDGQVVVTTREPRGVLIHVQPESAPTVRFVGQSSLVPQLPKLPEAPKPPEEPQAPQAPKALEPSESAETPSIAESLQAPEAPKATQSKKHSKAPKKPKSKERAAQVEEGPKVLETVVGRLSATEERAKDDARLMLKQKVAEWLDREVPASWSKIGVESDKLIESVAIESEDKDYAKVYRATLQADLSASRRKQIIERYRREVVIERIAKLGGGLAFTLVCLATLAGYIKADEATKGYYTNRLKLASAAGLGAAGVVLYRILT